ncbi:RagB/SusD family nutrient uptake outer membrane protein [Prolixibacteraceae bacterium JC049]|nr:RagB/SusD family nutrient uptake outer membrane protein [Prolixibacteraceae bacterium JC049]
MKKILAILILAVAIVGCDDFLEKEPLHTPDETTFWKTEADAEMAVNSLYNYLPNARRWWTECYSDNAIMTNAWGEGGLGEIKQGGLSATTGHIQSGYHWSPWRYDQIRQILYFIKNVQKIEVKDVAVKNNLEGQARFILAMRYFKMTRLFGGLPLIKEEPVSLDESKELTRSSQKEVFDYIVENVDKAVQMLPDAHDKSGRITKDAALMLKAEVWMWMASLEKFHGRSVSSKSADQLFAEAATAVKTIIDKKRYVLENDFVQIFQSVTNNTDNETILARQYVEDEVTNMINVLGVPGGVSLRGGGWASFSAPRNLIDDYECTDGKSIKESPLYDKANPWENRDRRLTSWFLLPKYKVLRQNGEYTLFESHPSYAGTAHREALGGEGGGGRSGYWGIKYVEMDNKIHYGYQNFIIYRYGETLLMLAECLNESDPTNNLIAWAMNKVRERAGLPGVDDILGNQEAMRKKILHERRVELVNEDRRYYDLLRTKTAEIFMNPPGNKLYGINKNEDDYNNAVGDWTKEKVIAEPIKFDASKGYLWPVPQDVIDKNDKITQNPGW